MDLLYEVFELLATVCESVLALWFLVSFFDYKFSVKYRKVSFVVVVVVSSFFTTVIPLLYPNDIIVNALVYILILFLYCRFVLKGKLVSHILMPIVSSTMLMLIAILMNSFLSFSMSTSSLEVINDRGVERIVILVFNKLLLFVAYKLILLMTKKNKTLLKQSEWIAFCAIFVSTLLSGICIYEGRLNSAENDNILLFILPTLGLVVINIVSFYMLARISKEHRDNLKTSLLSIQINEQEATLHEMRSLYKDIRKIRHDMEGQYGCLSGLISSGKYEQAQKYISSIEIPDFSSQAAISTDNDVVNAILGYLSSKCRSSNVKLNYTISSTNIDCFSAADISVIITNLVNNALEASINNGIKEIFLELFDQKNYYCIRIKNKINESVLAKNPNLKTTKSDKVLHGLGIESVKTLADKYDGITVFTEEKGFFVSEIWLKRPVELNLPPDRKI